MLKVVIADDEIKICELLELLVDWKTLGFQIVGFAHDGLEVLDYINKYNPEVVITDIQMPECSGIELLQQIHEAKMDIDILVISGYREFEYAKKALQYGAENYLLKPIKKVELIESLINIKNRREERLAEQSKLEETKRALMHSKDIVHTTLMEDILKGKRKILTKDEFKIDYQLDFKNPKQSWMTVKTDFILDDFDYKALEIFQQKISNSVQAILAESEIYGCTLPRWNMLLVLVDASVSQLERSYSRIIRSIKDFAGYNENVYVTIGVADVVQNNHFKAALQSSGAVMEQLHHGRNRVLEYAGSKKPHGTPIGLASDALQRVQDMIRSFDKDRLFQQLQNVIQEMHSGDIKMYSGEYVYRNLSLVLDQVFYQLQDINKDENFDEIKGQYDLGLRMCGRWFEYEEFFRKLSYEITQLNWTLQNEREKKPIKVAKQIIQERYNTSLTLEEISAELGLNHTYFSNIFKKETGMNVSVYITQLRIEQSKKLLSSTQMSIAEIAEMVGYNDEKYFLRRFKKEVGITLGEYRKLYGSVL